MSVQPLRRRAMKADSGIDLAALKVDGGASANDFLMQTQANIIKRTGKPSAVCKATAMGAAYLAGLADPCNGLVASWPF